MPETAAHTSEYSSELVSGISTWPSARIEDSRSRLSLRKVTSSTGRLRQADLRDLDFRETLTVAGQFAYALLRLVLEDQNLLVFALTDNFAGHAGVGNRRGAERDGVAALAAEDDLV